jgi:hypothetical protein
MKKVYVIYNDYGAYEGCSAPLAILTNKKKAEAYRAKGYEVEELELNDLSNLRSTRTNNKIGNIDIKEMMKSHIELELKSPLVNKKIINL